MAGDQRPLCEESPHDSLVDIFNMVDSVHFLSSLTSRDRRARQRAFNTIAAVIEQHADGYGSPVVPGNGFMLSNRPYCMLYGKSFLHVVLPGVLRLSIACPFQDVRDRALALLQDIEKGSGILGVKVPRPTCIGPSHFFITSLVSNNLFP